MIQRPMTISKLKSLSTCMAAEPRAPIVQVAEVGVFAPMHAMRRIVDWVTALAAVELIEGGEDR